MCSSPSGSETRAGTISRCNQLHLYKNVIVDESGHCRYSTSLHVQCWGRYRRQFAKKHKKDAQIVAKQTDEEVQKLCSKVVKVLLYGVHSPSAPPDVVTEPVCHVQVKLLLEREREVNNDLRAAYS